MLKLVLSTAVLSLQVTITNQTLSAKEALPATERAAVAHDFAAFEADHPGQHASQLNGSLRWSTAHGIVVHDGVCAYAQSGKLGCFDPLAGDDAGELACSRSVVLGQGVVWLYLHHARYVPFDAHEPQVRQQLPLWAYDQIEDGTGRGLYVWGMSVESGMDGHQELWHWTPGGAAVKLADGPRAMSGGLAAWPKEPSCLALASYAAAEKACDGTTTIWKWCAAEPAKFTPVKTFRGCSGRIEVGALAPRRGEDSLELWLVGSARAQRLGLTSDAVGRYLFSQESFGVVTSPDGKLYEVELEAGKLGVFEVQAQ